jgi:hypothetical protein
MLKGIFVNIELALSQRTVMVDFLCEYKKIRILVRIEAIADMPFQPCGNRHFTSYLIYNCRVRNLVEQIYSILCIHMYSMSMRYNVLLIQ